jgi:hypothetical protein
MNYLWKSVKIDMTNYWGVMQDGATRVNGKLKSADLYGIVIYQNEDYVEVMFKNGKDEDIKSRNFYFHQMEIEESDFKESGEIRRYIMVQLFDRTIGTQVKMFQWDYKEI